MSRKLIGIFLLGLWVFTCSSAFLAYRLERYYCHLEHFVTDAQTYGPGKKFLEFQYSDPSAINWQVKNKEIEVNQQFYDVIRIDVGSNKVILKVLPDKREDQSRTNFLAISKEKSRQGMINPFKSLTLTFIEDEAGSPLQLYPLKMGRRYPVVDQEYISFREIHSPPPETC